MDFQMTLTEGLSYIHFKKEEDLNLLLFVKFMEDNRRTYEFNSNNVPDNGIITIKELLRNLGDISYMQEGTMFTMSRDRRIVVYNFSQNRLVEVGVGRGKRFLLTNTIMQQSSRLFCRFSSLLPDLEDIEAFSFLVFYPFICLETDPSCKKYQNIYLKSKHRIRIEYDLTAEEIEKANEVRRILRDFLTFDYRRIVEARK